MASRPVPLSIPIATTLTSQCHDLSPTLISGSQLSTLQWNHSGTLKKTPGPHPQKFWVNWPGVWTWAGGQPELLAEVWWRTEEALQTWNSSVPDALLTPSFLVSEPPTSSPNPDGPRGGWAELISLASGIPRCLTRQQLLGSGFWYRAFAT